MRAYGVSVKTAQDIRNKRYAALLRRYPVISVSWNARRSIFQGTVFTFRLGFLVLRP